jgi:signal transduction histidine kinase
MKTTSTSLGEALPQAAIPRAWGWLGGYQQYPVFSWKWWLGRGAALWPVAALLGCAFATYHSAGMGEWRDWPPLAALGTFCGIIIVSAGPLLATGVRYLKLPYAVERVLVIAAVIAGVAIAVQAFNWFNAGHDALMARLPPRSSMTDGSWLERGLERVLGASLNTMNIVLFLAAGGLAVYSYLTEGGRLRDWDRRQELGALRRQKEDAELRLAVLQAQIEPHFLFNTLASVRSLAASKPDDAVRMIDALADYLRATLPQFRGQTLEPATLGAQLELCARYVDVMRFRFGDRVGLHVDAPDEARALPFPPLVLLTLVENAIKHGLEPKVGPGTVTISAANEDGGRLRVAVADDGVGLQGGVKHGLGLSNVRASLRARYGDRASLTLEGGPDGGTTAIVRIDTEAL